MVPVPCFSSSLNNCVYCTFTRVVFPLLSRLSVFSGDILARKNQFLLSESLQFSVMYAKRSVDARETLYKCTYVHFEETLFALAPVQHKKNTSRKGKRMNLNGFSYKKRFKTNSKYPKQTRCCLYSVEVY